MRARAKPTASPWRSLNLLATSVTLRRGSAIIAVGILTQLLILLTFFFSDSDSSSSPTIPSYSYIPPSSSSAYSSAVNFPVNLTHVNYPIHFERALTSLGMRYDAEQDDPTASATVPRIRRLPRLRCVQIVGAKGLQSIEGIGAVFRLNQLAVFLASYYRVDLAFPSKESEHHYDLGELFSDCGYRKTYMDFPNECVLNQERVFIEECASGDCHCLGRQYHKYVHRLVHDADCPVIGVLSDRYKTQQFSGCYQPLLYRYFGTKPLRSVSGSRKTPEEPQFQRFMQPYWNYDVIHYRHGDLADKPGGKSFAPYQIEHLMRTLCDMSDRDIIVLTENYPPVPHCLNESRVVVSNSSLEHAFVIMQYAKHVAVGLGGFSIILAEMARPVRMVMLDLHVRFFRWLPCDKWTVVTGSGARFHFGSRAHMLAYALSSANLHRERFLNPGDIKHKRLTWKVPTRVWSPELMVPLNLARPRA